MAIVNSPCNPLTKFPFKSLLLLALLPAVTSCATATADANPVRAQESAPVAAVDWWRAFGDPHLVDLIDAAYAANPDLGSARASLRAARAQRRIAGAALWPSLSADSSSGRNAGTSSYGAGLDASWELDIFGGNRYASAAAAEDLQASSANLEDLRLSLSAEVAGDYVQLRAAQAQLDILQRNLAAQRETVQLVAARQRVGLDSTLELNQAQLSAGQLEAQIPAQERTIAQQMHALAILCGAEPESLDAGLDSRLDSGLGAGSGVPYLAVPQPEIIPADLIRRRPDLRAAEHTLAAAGLRRDAAQAARYPSFRLGGALTFSSLEATDLLDSASMARSLLASIALPLFSGGSLSAQVEVRDAEREKAQNSYRKTLLTALADVADAYAALHSAALQLPRLEHNMALARDARDLAFSRYQSGAVDFQTVLDAQRQELSAEQALLGARADSSLATISMYRAVGGPW